MEQYTLIKKRHVLLLVPSILVIVALSFDFGLACEDLRAYPLYLVGFVAGLLTLMLAVYLGLQAGRNGIPMLVLCGALVGAYALLPNIVDWRYSWEFTRKRTSYMEVIELIRKGEIRPNTDSLAEIDHAHRYLLPCTNKIAIEENHEGLSVIFFTSNRLFGEFSGYMYIENGQIPSVQQFRKLRALNPDQWTSVRRLEANWFYVNWSH